MHYNTENFVEVRLGRMKQCQGVMFQNSGIYHWHYVDISQLTVLKGLLDVLHGYFKLFFFFVKCQEICEFVYYVNWIIIDLHNQF